MSTNEKSAQVAVSESKTQALDRVLNFARAMHRVQSAFGGFPSNETLETIRGHEIDFSDVVEVLESLSTLRAEREALVAECARLRGALKATRIELLGVGKESSHAFHRIGIDSALDILSAALRETSSGTGDTP